MIGITSDKLATWIIRLLRSFEFEKTEIQPAVRSIGLRLGLKEEVPDHVFMNLRFELLIPVIDTDSIEDPAERRRIIKEGRQYSKIVFKVEDVMAHLGSEPWYVLELVPIARDPLERFDEAKRQDNMDCLLALSDDMARTDHPLKKGAKLEWRNGFSRVRFYHAKHRGASAYVRNALYVPIPVTRMRGLIDRLPTDKGLQADREADDREIDALLTSADDAFRDPDQPPPLEELRRNAPMDGEIELDASELIDVQDIGPKKRAQTEPPPPPPRRLKHESFGYDVYMIHGQDFEEFDLDQGVAEALKPHHAA